MEKVLILSPHTDDAELGAGGYISKLIEEKKDILWVVFSSARESVPEGMANDILLREFLSLTKHLHLKEDQYLIYDHKVRHLFTKRQEILETLVQIKKDFDPDLVIGPSLNDYHQDHQIVANEMIRAYKTSSSIICYELPWNHLKFENQLFVELQKEHLDHKIEMLGHYKSQIAKQRKYFTSDFITGLARSRGIQIGAEFAEAFEVLRMIF